MSDCQSHRARYAEAIRQRAQLRSPAIVAAFASVPREHFLGRGPWAVWDTAAWRYVGTPDADPRHVYCDTPIAIRRERLLNNGQPSFVAMLIDALAPREGERVVHVGCGSGYYSAILATVVGASGCVTAIELDAELAALARANLASLKQVTVVCGDGCTYDAGAADAILINAGATHLCGVWLDRLNVGGRLVVPLVRWPTDRAESAAAGSGIVVMVTREAARYRARFVSSTSIFPCIGAVDADADRRLALALNRLSEVGSLRTLRRDRHESEPSCWLHGRDFCLSMCDGSG